MWRILATNSFLVKLVALSETIVSERPRVANIFRSSWMVLCDEVDGTVTISSHLEWASISSRNVFPGRGLHDLCAVVTMVRLATFMVAMEFWQVVFDSAGTAGNPSLWLQNL